MSARSIEQIVEGGKRTKLLLGCQKCVVVVLTSSHRRRIGTRGLVRFLASDSGHVIPKALNPSGRLPCVGILVHGVGYFDPLSRISSVCVSRAEFAEVLIGPESRKGVVARFLDLHSIAFYYERIMIQM